jgi:hypothetical protein
VQPRRRLAGAVRGASGRDARLERAVATDGPGDLASIWNAKRSEITTCPSWPITSTDVATAPTGTRPSAASRTIRVSTAPADAR